MKKNGRQLPFIGLICLLPLLSGCGNSVGGNPLASHLLTVTRASALSANGFPPFVKTIDDSASTSRLYDAINALPLSQGIYSCPADDGLQYQLTFALQGATKQKMIVSGSGCRTVALNKSDIRMTNEAFWSLFAQTLGYQRQNSFHALFPTESRLNFDKE